MASLPWVYQPAGPPKGQPGWYEVGLDDGTLLALWWDGSHWSDDAQGTEPWSKNAADGIRGWWLLRAEP